MDTKKIEKLEAELQDTIVSTTSLSGGSGDSIYLLETSIGKKYVYKSGTYESISSQSKFYKEYSNLPYFPKLISFEKKELLIEYFEFEEAFHNYEKVNIINDLIDNIISKYKNYDSNRYGFISGYIVGSSFSEFLQNQLTEAYTYIKNIISKDEFDELLSLVNTVYSDKVFSKKYLLHGDLGFHNLFYSSNKPLGIIDPDPIIGHPLYDFLYLFCSTPKQIGMYSYEKCFNTFVKYYPEIDLNKKTGYLKIALFKRISSCCKHHPSDLDDYLAVWENIR